MRISIASAKAIRYACLKFHYAHAVPPVGYGFNVFNDSDEWCGVICYGVGSNKSIGSPFGVAGGEALELVRVALNGKQETTSQAVAMTLRELRRVAPHVKIIVSYADTDQGHKGIIYQATNWIYLGKQQINGVTFVIHGKKIHRRSVNTKYGTSSISWLREHMDRNVYTLDSDGKHKYVYPFDKRIRKQVSKLAVPYPKGE